MKPVKNRFFCIDCGFAKMRFETEKSALRFIEYNADEIAKENNGRAPKRAYYCSLCCSWHVTSRCNSHNYTSFTELYISGHSDKIATIKKRRKENGEKCKSDPTFRLTKQIENCQYEIDTAKRMLANKLPKNAIIAFNMATKLLDKAIETKGLERQKKECLHQLEQLQPMLMAG